MKHCTNSFQTSKTLWRWFGYGWRRTAMVLTPDLTGREALKIVFSGLNLTTRARSAGLEPSRSSASKSNVSWKHGLGGLRVPRHTHLAANESKPHLASHLLPPPSQPTLHAAHASLRVWHIRSAINLCHTTTAVNTAPTLAWQHKPPHQSNLNSQTRH